MPPRCPHCPVDERAPGCEGQLVGRFCELVDPTRADYNPAYRDLLLDLASGAGAGARAAPEPASPLPLAETLARLREMNACPHREARADCGCAGLAVCRLGRGRAGRVNHRDCLDCLAAVHASG